MTAVGGGVWWWYGSGMVGVHGCGPRGSRLTTSFIENGMHMKSTW